MFEKLSSEIVGLLVLLGAIVILLLFIKMIFGDRLKKMEVRISPKEGIELDIETHIIGSFKPAEEAISDQSLRTTIENVIPKKHYDVISNYHVFGDDEELIYRTIIRIFRLVQKFHAQEVPLKYFNWYNHKGKMILHPFRQLSILSRSVSMQIDICATQVQIPILSRSILSREGVKTLFIVCQPEMPYNIIDTWVRKVVEVNPYLPNDAIIWAINMADKMPSRIGNDFPGKVSYYSKEFWEKNRILFSTGTDISFLEALL